MILLVVFILIRCTNSTGSNTDQNEKIEIEKEPKNDVRIIIDEKNEDNSEDHVNIPEEFLLLEREYSETLKPILSLKNSNPKTYWFIVSWLKTNYASPNWDNYNNTSWRVKTKQSGIDCSGFARVMQAEIFDQKITGGSQMILDNQCTRIDPNSLAMGDLVFFRAPYSDSDRIVHVGVYLFDDLFVHATSTRSAAEGLGLNVNSLNEENWKRDFVTGGKIKEF